jgi:hypothetical protein
MANLNRRLPAPAGRVSTANVESEGQEEIPGGNRG